MDTKAKVIWMQPRHGKVESRYGIKRKPVRFSRRMHKKLPFINVSGNWLTSAGFEIGDDIVVSVAQNRLTIEKVVDDASDVS